MYTQYQVRLYTLRVSEYIRVFLMCNPKSSGFSHDSTLYTGVNLVVYKSNPRSNPICGFNGWTGTPVVFALYRPSLLQLWLDCRTQQLRVHLCLVSELRLSSTQIIFGNVHHLQLALLPQALHTVWAVHSVTALIWPLQYCLLTSCWLVNMWADLVSSYIYRPGMNTPASSRNISVLF